METPRKFDRDQEGLFTADGHEVCGISVSNIADNGKMTALDL